MTLSKCDRIKSFSQGTIVSTTYRPENLWDWNRLSEKQPIKKEVVRGDYSKTLGVNCLTMNLGVAKWSERVNEPNGLINMLLINFFHITLIPHLDSECQMQIQETYFKHKCYIPPKVHLLLQLIAVSDSIFHHLLFDFCSADRQEVKCVVGGDGSHLFALWGNPAPSGEMMCLMCEAGLSCRHQCLRLLMSHQKLMRHKGWWEGKRQGNGALNVLSVPRSTGSDRTLTCWRSVRWCLIDRWYLKIQHLTPTWHCIQCLWCKKTLRHTGSIIRSGELPPAVDSASKPITDALLTGRQPSDCRKRHLPPPQCETPEWTKRHGVAPGKVMTRGRRHCSKEERTRWWRQSWDCCSDLIRLTTALSHQKTNLFFNRDF